jgi:PKD repeat protein
MKKTILTLLLFAAAISGLNAQTFFVVHGTVNNLNGQPVNGHQVFIASDSLNSPPSWNFFDVVYTNPNGYFMDTVPFIGGTNMAFRIYTFDCNQMIHDTLVYSGSQQGMIEFNICDQATPGCQAAFQAYTDSAGTHFTDYSVGNISNWLWNFGDTTAGIANTSTLQNPSHIYTFPGVYMVCLIVSSGDSLGCTSTWCDYINIGNATGCQAAFQAYPDSAGTLTYQFLDYSVGNNFSWAWNFGDPASGTMNFTTVQNPAHTFSSPGVFTVCLTITSADSTWCINTWCDNITVGNVPGCQAAFQAYPDSSGNMSYQFIDYSVGAISGWYWNFGDNTASYEQNPQHTYAGPGVYNVCLNIWSNDTLGCTSTWCDSIVVGNVPNCYNNFTYTVAQLTASFAGMAFGYSNPQYTWSFGDGTSGTGQNITHTYAAAGYYFATLTTTDNPSTGCSTVLTRQIYIGQQQGDIIWGQVTAGNTFADNARVLLYATTGGTNIFTLIDSTIVDSSGYYQFTGINYNVIFLKAELLPTSVYYGDYMPTYFDSAMYWNEATGIVVYQPNNQYNIGLLPVAWITNTGNGEMNGSVTYGSGKGMAASEVEVILLDASGNPLAYTYTDNAGWFSFADLGYDTYSVYVEMPGLTTSPASATLDASSPTSTMAFVILENSIALSIEEQLPNGFKSVGQIFPNPARGEASIMLNLERTSTFELKVINFTGNTLSTEELTKPTGHHKVVLNTIQLSSGVYGLLITSPDGSRTIRKFLLIR